MKTDTPRTDEEARQYPGGFWVGANFARELERENAALRDADNRDRLDRARIDWIASWWDSQCTSPQPLLAGRLIGNPTGSFRDAIDNARGPAPLPVIRTDL